MQVEALIDDKLRAHQDGVLAAMDTMLTNMTKMSSNAQLSLL